MSRPRPLLPAAAAALLLACAPAARAELAYGVAESLSGPDRLVSFDTSDPGTILSDVAVPLQSEFESLYGIDFRPNDGRLYGLSFLDRLYTIDTVTGAATVVATLDTDVGGFAVSGFDFTPDGRTLRLVKQVSSAPEANYRINPDTGAVTVDGGVEYPAGDPRSLFASGLAYTPGGRAYLIDPRPLSSGGGTVLLELTDPNAGTTAVVGDLGIGSGSGANGFDVSNVTGVAYATIATSLTDDTLVRINLATGAATVIGGLGAIPENAVATRLDGFALAVPEPTGAAVAFVVAGLALRRRR